MCLKMLKTTRALFIFVLSFLRSATCNVEDATIQEWLTYLSANLGNCSDYFQYQRIDKFINGRLELNNMKMDDTIKLTFNKIDYSHHPVDGQRNKGILLPDESAQTVIQRIQNGQIITYRVDFPITTDVPKLIKIFVNGKDLCATKFNASGELLVLRYTLEIINDALPVFTYNINIPNFADTENGLTPLIYGGSEIRRGEYPWLTAIYKKQRTGLSFICGGSLVSSSFILTAAHCLQGSSLNAARIVAILGRHDLSNYMEESSMKRQIGILILHPEYKYGRGFSDADLALLKMENHVGFTPFIKPICLWTKSADESLIVNHIGVVAGWGDDDDEGLAKVPKKAKVRIVSEAVCLRSSVAFIGLTSTRTLCAGNRYGSGPCEGDSGGGLMFMQNGRWMLRGVVSAGLLSKQRCNSLKYTVYCDIAKHLNWLKNYIDQNEPSIADSSSTICGISDIELQKQPISMSLEDICGRSDIESRSEYSWLAAIYTKEFAGLLFSNTGVLISSRNVLGRGVGTIYNDKEKMPPDVFRIYLGWYDLSNIQATGVVALDVATITYHPDFKADDPFSENNIVVYEMKTSVSFTYHVVPICLWNDLNGMKSQIVESAAISSWYKSGVIQNSFPTPTSVKVNLTSIQDCQLWGYNESISARLLCVPRLENKNGGFLMVKQKGRWLLRGINALRYSYDTYMSKNFFVYSDISKYLLWIQKYMKT